MRSVILEQPGRFKAISLPDEAAPGAGEVLVRVQRIGICGTDLHAFAGNQPFFSYPRMLGHELGVTVESVGDGVSNVRPGDRCAVEPYLNCGICVACRAGKTNCCTKLKVLGVHIDGGMRERIVLPARKLHRSDKLSLDQLALVETLGIGAHAVDRAAVQPGEFVLVIGAGPIGLSVIQFAQAAGAKVIVADISASRLEFCRRNLKVEHLVDPRANLTEQLATVTNGDFPTAVFDATGNPRSMMSAFGFPAHGGRLVFVGLFQGDVTFNDPEFHRRELTLLASRNSRTADFERIIRLIEDGSIDTTPWITHRATLDEMIERFASWTDPANGVIKAMVAV
jgi:2-desacetyl-2-hydroxyethyl bacteriochlorophyllide A dehydrogenase